MPAATAIASVPLTPSHTSSLRTREDRHRPHPLPLSSLFTPPHMNAAAAPADSSTVRHPAPASSTTILAPVPMVAHRAGNKRVASVSMRRTLASIGAPPNAPSMQRDRPPVARVAPVAIPMASSAPRRFPVDQSTAMGREYPMGGIAMQRSVASMGVDGNPFATQPPVHSPPTHDLIDLPVAVRRRTAHRVVPANETPRRTRARGLSAPPPRCTSACATAAAVAAVCAVGGNRSLRTPSTMAPIRALPWHPDDMTTNSSLFAATMVRAE